MHPNIKNFMNSVLGEDGASALLKAAERSPVLEGVVLPRSVVSWLSFASRVGGEYDGEIPGMPDSYMEFRKSGEDSFDGVITVGTEVYEFQNASALQLAAATTVALGADTLKIDPTLKGIDIVRLGKNIDLLIGTRYLNLAKKALEERSSSSSSSSEESSMSKEEPGQAAGFLKPLAPTPAVPQAKQPKIKNKTPNLKVSKSKSEHECSVCGAAQFSGDVFQGCFCLRELCKYATADKANNGFVIHFGPEWSSNDISILVDILGE